MSRTLRQAYTKPIPSEATIVIVKGVKHAKFKDGDNIITAPLAAT